MNVLDYTTVVIPVTKANSKIDVFDSSYVPMSEKDEKNWKACETTLSCCRKINLTISLVQTMQRYMMGLLLQFKSCVGDKKKRKYSQLLRSLWMPSANTGRRKISDECLVLERLLI